MLSIVATPIGNLGDITLRAIETLKTCDAVVCEDTRVTGNLLKQLAIEKKELISFHGYSDEGKLTHILHLLQTGKHLALVTDAGTPGLSDPGFAIISKARELRLPIEVVPGPAALLAALSGSGLPMNTFVFLGFLPLKKGRKTLFESLKNEERTIAFYESVHRIERTLTEIADALKEQPMRRIVIAREITKLHEEFIPTDIHNLPAVARLMTKKGEFVVVIGAL
jgi:16S rRNA (cytidine1402-2'-O)-methyltransferase